MSMRDSGAARGRRAAALALAAIAAGAVVDGGRLPVLGDAWAYLLPSTTSLGSPTSRDALGCEAEADGRQVVAFDGDPARVCVAAGHGFTAGFAGVPDAFRALAERRRNGLVLALPDVPALFSPSPGGAAQAFTPVATERTASGVTDVFRAVAGGVAQAEVRQELALVPGTADVTVRYVVRNLTARALRVQGWLQAVAHPAPAANVPDAGPRTSGTVGEAGAGRPRTLTVRDDLAGSAVAFVEGTPWGRYAIGSPAAVLPDHHDDAVVTGVDQAPVEKALVVQWDDHASLGTAIAPGAEVEWTATLRLRRPRLLALEQASDRFQLGDRLAVRVRATDDRGAGGQLVRWSVTGANPASGALELDAAGQGTLSWQGTTVGRDDLTAYVDRDRDGARDDGEPLAGGAVSWMGGVPDPPCADCTLGAGGQARPKLIVIPTDRTRPLLRVGARRMSLRGVLAQGLVVSATTTEPATVRWRLLLDRAAAARLGLRLAPRRVRGRSVVVLGATPRVLAGADQRLTATLQVKPSLRAALQRARGLRAVVEVTGTEPSGNAGRATRTIRLR
ncbi:hypothetical protein [Conexibacter sp. SYSU D00693]|uniref:hypothetical protein n=1 Tax=Conexibacter sp. SYSU D00693 TaxID=2812560 RepID=UPI00196B1493|nr:hypothetical protein [Conexibacter sp. SYSU D00693]